MLDIHARFVSWFLVGFILALGPCVAAPIIATAERINETLMEVFAAFFSCCIGCGGIAWWIVGFFWRFSASGCYASGSELSKDMRMALEDQETLYQIHSGKFMLFYYIAVLSVLGFIIISTFVTQIVFNCWIKN